MVRGLPFADADARLVVERGRAAPAEAELVFAIDLSRAVLAIRDAEAPPPVIDGLMALYTAQKRPGRRRALMEDAVGKAGYVNADRVLEALAARDITDVARGTLERKEAERPFVER